MDRWSIVSLRRDRERQQQARRETQEEEDGKAREEKAEAREVVETSKTEFKSRNKMRINEKSNGKNANRNKI